MFCKFAGKFAYRIYILDLLLSANYTCNESLPADTIINIPTVESNFLYHLFQKFSPNNNLTKGRLI